jgi:hypothetical protein
MADKDAGGRWPHLSDGGGTDVAENVVYSLQGFARNHHAGELRLAIRADLRAYEAHPEFMLTVGLIEQAAIRAVLHFGGSRFG